MALPRATDIDLDALVEMSDEIPGQTLALRELACDVAEKIVARLRQAAERQSKRATLWESIKLLASEALARLDVRWFDLPDERVAILGSLAGSLNNLGNRLSDLGRREDALAASQEAVEIERRLSQEGV